jgi:peptidyl-prolyl cis-trans isomerase B (cyclophilin B)
MHDASPHLDGQYSAFGVVVRGLEVVDAIAKTRTGPGDRPVAKQEIKSAKVVPAPAKQ